MKYFIDHMRKSIHSQKFAGDSCGFVSTPVTHREFTNSPAYVKELLTEKSYTQCPYCVTAPTRLQRKTFS